VLVYCKGVNVKVDEHSEMKKEVATCNKTALFTTDRQVVLNFCCRATVLAYGDQLQAKMLEDFVWKQGVTVLDASYSVVEDIMKNHKNYYSGCSQLFRVMVFASAPKYMDIAFFVRSMSPYIPVLIAVSSNVSEQPTLTFKVFPAHTAEACVSADVYNQHRIKVTTGQQDIFFFGLMRPLLWAPDLLVGTLLKARGVGSNETQTTVDRPSKSLTAEPKLPDGFLQFQTITIANIYPRDKKELVDPFLHMCSDTLEFQSKNERDGGSSSKNEPRKSRIGTKEIKADFKKSRTDPKMKCMSAKWEHLDADDKWKFNCTFSSAFVLEVFDHKERVSHGCVEFTVRDLLTQMPIDDCQLEITFPFKNPTADSNSYRNSAISPRFRAKKVQVAGTVTMTVKWIPPEETADTPRASKHFGVPLAISLETAKKDGHEHIAIKMMRHIEANAKKIESVGIFRVNAGAGEIRAMTATVEKGEVLVLHPYKITDVAGLLKKYFKDLPTLLFPEELWPEMKQIETIKELQDWEDVKIFQAIYQKMPIFNRVMIKNLMKMLADVAYWCDINKMTAENLAVVWAPNILVPKKLVGNEFLAANKVALPILTFIIEWAYDIFNMNKFEKLWADDQDEECDSFDEKEVPGGNVDQSRRHEHD